VQGFLSPWKDLHDAKWKSTAFKFASLLLEPSTGDVVFVVRATDNTTQNLYAYKSVLAVNSEYFASSLGFKHDVNLSLGFKPEWRSQKSEQTSAVPEAGESWLELVPH